MAEFMVVEVHDPADCEKLFREWVSFDSPLKGRGITFFCTCPSGNHGGFTHVEAASREDVLAMLPDQLRRTAKVYAGETMPLDV